MSIGACRAVWGTRARLGYASFDAQLQKRIVTTRPVGRGGSRGFVRTPFWLPKDFICTAIVHFKCPTGPLVLLLLRITAVQASLVAAMWVCS